DGRTQCLMHARLPRLSNETYRPSFCLIAQAPPDCASRPYARSRSLCQVAAKALDAPARFLQVLGLGRIGDAKGGTETERRTLHHRHPLRLQQFGDEVLVGDELVTGR